MKKLLIICLAAVSISANAQTNGGFETWSTVFGIEEASGWTSSNLMTLLGFADSLSVRKSTNACNSKYSARISSYVFNLGGPDTVSGGMFQQIAFSSRPKTLRYCYAYQCGMPDSATITVEFYKGNTDSADNLIGAVTADLAPTKIWQTGVATIDWLSSETPDSVIIDIEGGKDGHWTDLLIDNISLSDFAAGITDYKSANAKVYMDANRNLHADLPANAEPAIFTLVNLKGEVVYEGQFNYNQNTVSTDLFSAGIYAWKLCSINGVVQYQTGKLVMP